MKKRKLFEIQCPIVLLLLITLLLPSMCPAAGREARIAVILSSDIEPYFQALDGFKKFFDWKKVRLQASEYNLKVRDHQPGEVIHNIIEEKPGIVFTVGPQATRLVKENLKKIPVVFAMVLNPEAFTAPNATGVSLNIATETKLEVLKKILPNANRIGVICSPKSSSAYRDLGRTCEKIGLHFIGREINSKKEFPDALNDISWRIDMFLMIPDPGIYFPQSIRHLLFESQREKFPVIGLSATYTRAGALLSFDADYRDIGWQAGKVALEILQGEPPGNIKPSEPRKIHFSLNLLVADRLGIKIPPQIIKEANEVFSR